jgi:hypothetical protein
MLTPLTHTLCSHLSHSRTLLSPLTLARTQGVLANIKVEYGEMQLARLFANSPRSLEEYPDHDPRVRQAISLGRRFQNSEREFAAAFNQDNEILSLAWHSLQNMVSCLYIALIISLSLPCVVSLQCSHSFFAVAPAC